MVHGLVPVVLFEAPVVFGYFKGSRYTRATYMLSIFTQAAVHV